MIEPINGIEVRSVGVDPDRAPRVVWSFEQYATGDWSVARVRDALEERSFESRTTAEVVGGPLTGRRFTASDYRGQIAYKGAPYEGAHEPLVDDALRQRVQDVLAGRREWAWGPTTTTSSASDGIPAAPR